MPALVPDKTRLPKLSDQIEAARALLCALESPSSVDFLFHWGVPTLFLAYMQEEFETSLGISYVIPACPVAAWRERLARNHRPSLEKVREEIEAGHLAVTRQERFRPCALTLLRSAGRWIERRRSRRAPPKGTDA